MIGTKRTKSSPSSKVEAPSKKREIKADSKEKKTTTRGGSIEVMLAQSYEPETHKCEGWLMSEKLDGVRCYWNGKNLYTRNGKSIYAPDDWKS